MNANSISDTIYPVREFLFPSSAKAQIALGRMQNLIDWQGKVPLSVLYLSMGVAVKKSDTKWGWRTLIPASIVQTENGFALHLPPVTKID